MYITAVIPSWFEKTRERGPAKLMHLVRRPRNERTEEETGLFVPGRAKENKGSVLCVKTVERTYVVDGA